MRGDRNAIVALTNIEGGSSDAVNGGEHAPFGGIDHAQRELTVNLFQQFAVKSAVELQKLFSDRAFLADERIVGDSWASMNQYGDA